jgi:cytochrome c-type biogenesis protein CcmH
MKHKMLMTLAVTLACLLVLGGLAGAASAQDDGTTKKPVTADDVNNVARKLYCPVCENIPLDTCGTTACEQWRGEIRFQLEEGRTAQQVIDDFIARFGDRVVGTPVDPVLRALSLWVPILISLGALVGAGMIFNRWRMAPRGAAPRHEANPEAVYVATAAATKPDEFYRARLELDLAKRQ